MFFVEHENMLATTCRGVCDTLCCAYKRGPAPARYPRCSRQQPPLQHKKIGAQNPLVAFRKSANILAAVETCKTRRDESRFTPSNSSIWAPAGRP
jgi:hypothetical protein